mgnify:CR=1 FL=1|tara:strand:+ start:1478 stop:2137 length:660 start_codon:yes stop_codon:yes gene_type:complete
MVFCKRCDKQQEEGHNFCPECGSSLIRDSVTEENTSDQINQETYDDDRQGVWKATEVETGIRERSSNPGAKRWYQTGWVWVWLIVVWPIGAYGLIQRAKPEHRKWWYTGVAILFALAVFGEEGGQPGSASSNAGGDDVGNAYRICAAADSTGLLSQECEVSAFDSAIDLYIATSATEARKICRGIRASSRSEGVRFKNDWKIRIYSPFSSGHTIAQCAL